VTYETQIRDVALAALVIMKKQDAKKFGFDRIQQNTTNVFSTNTVGFENDEKRDKALAKWKEFKSAEKKKQVRKGPRKSKTTTTIKIPAGKYGNLPDNPDQIIEVKEKGPRP
jgi:hypothetical protein